MGIFGVSRGVGVRRVVETVFIKRLSIFGIVDDDIVFYEVQYRINLVRVQGVVKVYDGGFTVGIYRELDGGDYGVESWGDTERVVSGYIYYILRVVGRFFFVLYIYIFGF